MDVSSRPALLKIDNVSHLEEPLMMLLEKTLPPHATENLTPYLLFSNVFSDTSALKDSSIASPASPLSWT